jgi:hypothetical protein
MSALTKLAGLVAGASAVAVIGVAIAQGQPPNPLITNHAIGAGQQSTHVTPMGETGVLTGIGEIRTAAIIKQEEVAVVSEPAPAQEQVAVVQETTTMGAPPAPAEPAPMPAKQDRN